MKKTSTDGSFTLYESECSTQKNTKNKKDISLRYPFCVKKVIEVFLRFKKISSVEMIELRKLDNLI
jgi:hypothetical protein